jgi:hypothetical protein
MGFWYGDGKRRKNEVRAIIFSKRRETILGSGRRWQEKRVIGGQNSIFWVFVTGFVGGKGESKEVLAESFLQNQGKKMKKRVFFCKKWRERDRGKG